MIPILFFNIVLVVIVYIIFIFIIILVICILFYLDMLIDDSRLYKNWLFNFIDDAAFPIMFYNISITIGIRLS